MKIVVRVCLVGMVMSLQQPSSWPSKNRLKSTDFSRDDVMYELEVATRRTTLLTPEQRVLMTSCVDTPRLLSSWFNAPVLRTTLQDERIRAGLYECQHVYSIGTTPICTTTSILLGIDHDAAQFLDAENHDLTHLHQVLGGPPLRLVHVAADEVNLSRTYSLASPTIKCQVHESFPVDIFDDSFHHELWQLSSA